MPGMTYRELNARLIEILYYWPQLRTDPKMEAVESLFHSEGARRNLNEALPEDALRVVEEFYASGSVAGVIGPIPPGPIPPLPMGRCGEFKYRHEDGSDFIPRFPWENA